MVWGYQTFLVVISTITAYAAIATVLMLFVNLQKIRWGALINNSNECVELLQKVRRENPDSTEENIPEACLLVAHSLSDVIVSDVIVYLLWSGFLYLYCLWNACKLNLSPCGCSCDSNGLLVAALFAVSGYYKELTEEVDGGIALKLTADNALPTYNESLPADQGSIRMRLKVTVCVLRI